MALRLILVGAVAGLGLNLPVRDTAREWRHSAETWVYSRMAEWDARMPTGENAFVIVAEPTAPAAPVVADLPATAVPAAARPIVSSPASSETELTAGIDVPTLPMDLDEPVEEFPATVPDLTDADFDRVQDEIVADLTADLHRIEAEQRLAAAPVVVGDELYESFAFALERVSESTNAALASVEPLRSVPRFEPLEVGEDLYGGVAFELNRAAEGLCSEGASAATGASVDSRSRLTQAVRLTREAVHAWANLLHGPAVVVISH